MTIRGDHSQGVIYGPFLFRQKRSPKKVFFDLYQLTNWQIRCGSQVPFWSDIFWTDGRGTFRDGWRPKESSHALGVSFILRTGGNCGAWEGKMTSKVRSIAKKYWEINLSADLMCNVTLYVVRVRYPDWSKVHQPWNKSVIVWNKNKIFKPRLTVINWLHR